MIVVRAVQLVTAIVLVVWGALLAWFVFRVVTALC